MKRIARFVLSLAVACLPFKLPATAQTQSLFQKWTFNLGAGVTPTVGDISHRLDTGWNFQAGAGYNFTKHLAIIGQYQYNGLGVSRSVLNELAVPDGNAHVWSLTANPMLKINPDGRFGGYIIGGAGFYRRVIQFTKPTLVQIFVFDPFFGVIFPALVPANTVLGTFTDNTGGVNIGGGLTFKVGSGGAKIYAESRYHWIDTTNRDTQLIPVTFGIRW